MEAAAAARLRLGERPHLKLPPSRSARGSVSLVVVEGIMLRVRVMHDGTYRAYRDRLALASGLRHQQPDKFASLIVAEYA